ncbi:hypothetical protein N7E81_12545 [Reichenbachiella carrageenanivorans]|uniref:Uncharacterized protein n=1 Tax=Reichenbachiella carrageenanivorans TaxID=2979869 RepID=A0ABY6CWU4_9BACT|nr:hypothetical protein [Reichenbachiella carrageenanivorans]UXX78189.1 hypothetical protein N7E81_12545 [Reichenbachiella carrageenanivorans]
MRVIKTANKSPIIIDGSSHDHFGICSILQVAQHSGYELTNGHITSQ